MKGRFKSYRSHLRYGWDLYYKLGDYLCTAYISQDLLDDGMAKKLIPLFKAELKEKARARNNV